MYLIPDTGLFISSLVLNVPCYFVIFLINVFQFLIIVLKFLFAGLFEAVSIKRYEMVCASIKNS